MSIPNVVLAKIVEFATVFEANRKVLPAHTMRIENDHFVIWVDKGHRQVKLQCVWDRYRRDKLNSALRLANERMSTAKTMLAPVADTRQANATAERTEPSKRRRMQAHFAEAKAELDAQTKVAASIEKELDNLRDMEYFAYNTSEVADSNKVELGCQSIYSGTKTQGKRSRSSSASRTAQTKSSETEESSEKSSPAEESTTTK